MVAVPGRGRSTSGRIAQGLYLSFLLALLARPAFAACPDFASATPVAAGTTPSAVAVGDFNGDGIADLAIANAGANNVSILLGNGSGGFSAAASPAVGSSPVAVVAGDFDGDGRLDLAVANSGSDNISILTGNGNGTFAAAVNYVVGTAPVAIALGDFNRDGRLDLAVADSGSNEISILLGSVAGTLGAAGSVSAGTAPASIAVADLNGDGKLDLAVANRNSNNVSILIGNGSGSFSGSITPAAGSAPAWVAAGDFNRDGNADLAVANYGSNDVSILIGNGSGGFAAAVSYSVGTHPAWLSVADFDGDGKPDLAIANSSALSNSVSILIGSGSGTFATALNYGAGTGPDSIAVGDFDKDGRPDLAVANGGSNNVSILLNNGACYANCGTFASASSHATGTAPYSIAVGDLDGDGKLDLAVVNSSTDNVSILRGIGNGSFAAAVNYTVGTTPRSIAIGDFNRDGKLDLAVADEGTNDVSILLNNGSGGFGTAVSYGAGTGPSAVAIGDFNRDGKLDLAVANSASNDVSILLGAGDGTFGAAASQQAGTAPKAIVVGDFNGDGKPDVAIANSGSNTVSILQGSGTGGFTGGGNFSTAFTPVSIAAGDFNGDGKLDLAVVNNGSTNISILLGAANGTFGVATNFTAGTNPKAVAVGDFNGDGKLDLAVANAGSNNLLILFGNGDGTFASPIGYGAGTTPQSVAVGDFDGDGKLDLASANSGSDDASTLLSTCPPPDLTVSVSHAGSFTQGDAAQTYSITVNNVGTGPASGVVSVTVTLPAGLTATGIDGGSGWTCTLATLTCTRSTALAAGSSYSSITLTVSVNPDAPATVTNNATVSGGHEINTANDSASDLTAINQVPDLAITKTHSGNFTQGQTGAPYTITVSNLGGASTFGTVTMTETLPAGLTATALGGSGWNCTPLAALTCTRSDALASGASYPAITLTVNVATNAAALVTNTASVSGAGENYTADNVANDPTTINQVPDLTVVKTHSGNFTQGQNGQTYSIVVTNSGSSPTSGTVTVSDTLPAGLTATAMSGTGWNCTPLSALTCTRSDALGAGSSYATITLTVNVAGNAAASVINTATVSGGGEIYTANDSSSDSTTVLQPPDLTVAVTHSGTFTQGQMFATYAITASNLGPGPTNALVTVTDALPAGLTATSIGGTGWTCSPVTLTCTRSDGLAASSSYPPIKLTVNVATNAPASVVNTATVSGGSELNTSNDTANDFTGVNAVGAGCGTFGAAAVVANGTQLTPSSVAIGDFNRDGIPDLVVGNYSSGTISIVQGNGNGTFQAGVPYFAGDGPTAVAVGDFNGDGIVDLAVANYGGASAKNLSILLGNADGTFGAHTDYTVGSVPTSLILRDFNGDGRLDIAVANGGSNNVSILLGNGNGTFSAAVNYDVGSTPGSVAVGDFNGDGVLDLATANSNSDDISILIGNANGTFKAAVSYPAGPLPNSVAVGDLNGDGILDLAIADSGVDVSTSSVAILLGNGNGTFRAKVQYGAHDFPRFVAIGDFDNDGKPDLAVANMGLYNDTSDSDVSILRGNGDGTFAAAVNYAVYTNPVSIAIGDFNGDGKADLAVTGWASNDLSILLNVCPDLAIAKTHSGSFTQGQAGALYTLTARNAGPVPTSGTITVTDSLPVGLTASAIGGDGWNCTLSTLTCTRSDVLAASASYPAITVTVNVNSDAAATVINTASVSGAGDRNPANNSVNDSTTIIPSGLIAPTNLVVSAFGPPTSQVTLNWNAVTTAANYQVFRSSGGGPYNIIATVGVNAFADSGLAPNTTYLYQVKAVDGSSNVSGPSNTDMVTTILFTDDPVSAGFTLIKAVHLTELRTAVNSVRAAAGLAPASFTDPSLSGVVIKAIHFTELRSYLDEARAIIGVSRLVYTDPTLSSAVTVKAAHILELRRGVKGFINT